VNRYRKIGRRERHRYGRAKIAASLQIDARAFFRAILIEKAKLNPFGMAEKMAKLAPSLSSVAPIRALGAVIRLLARLLTLVVHFAQAYCACPPVQGGKALAKAARGIFYRMTNQNRVMRCLV